MGALSAWHSERIPRRMGAFFGRGGVCIRPISPGSKLNNEHACDGSSTYKHQRSPDGYSWDTICKQIDEQNLCTETR